MNEITFLTKDQICDYKNALEIFKKYGTNAAITDFSILLGAAVSNDHTCDCVYNKDPKYSDTRTADYWTKTKENDKVVTISSYSFGYNSPKHMFDRSISIRPALRYSYIKDKCTKTSYSDHNVLEVEYGQYPQTICENTINKILEKEYQNNNLIKTDKSYTVDSKANNYYDKFKPEIYQEYQYNNKKYIRFIYDRNNIRTKLSDRKYIEYGKAYWIEVEPITWMVDEKTDIAITKKLLITGIPFNSKNYDGIFENTDIYNYLNKYFLKEIKSHKKTDNQKNENNIIEEIINNMNLEELQNLRFLIERQIKEKVKIKRKGGI